ncbi:SURF1 family protein [Novosphingobium sp.]|uniref:SURF1 family protein n=1 Tax=Novosphingobium sp. TaxID=1874826 RepID=UPI003B52830F
MRRPPLAATLVVLLAVAIMVGLGFWQVHRRAWKEAMLAQFTVAEQVTTPLVITGADLPDNAGYRHVRWDCPTSGPDQVVGGRNADGRYGWAHVFVCMHGASVPVPVVIGWSPGVTPVQWTGRAIAGVAVPGPKAGIVLHNADGSARETAWHIVADPPLAGLIANARPDPRDIPNNHWSYAIQWFAFAVIALVIYGMALRRR